MENTDQRNESIESLRSQIVRTRSGLKQSFNELEQQVSSVVSDARSTVREGVETTKEFFTVAHHGKERPWQLVAFAVGVGTVCGAVVRNRSDDVVAGSASHSRSQANGYPRPDATPAQSDLGVFGRVAEQLSNELQQVKRLALGSGVGIAASFAKDSLPNFLGIHIDRIADQLVSNRSKDGAAR